jgi:methylated-DNA-[protein]-cysteine S-methyltransferase
MVTVDEVASPIGPLTIAERSGRVCLLHFGADGADVDACLGRWYPGEERVRAPIDSIRLALQTYFAGDCRALDALAVELNGTPFQRKVWKALRDIPSGSTLSYADLARRIGEPRAVRAVGAANGANPVAVIVPCHRVIGTDGTLTGYGGGLERKQWLLAHEGVLPRLPL